MQIDYDTIILGAGFGGIGLAILLKQAGRDEFCIMEPAQAVGGMISPWPASAWPASAARPRRSSLFRGSRLRWRG